MKNIVDKLMELWTGKEKSWSRKSSTTVIFPYKIFSVFTVPRYEIWHEILPHILPQIQYSTVIFPYNAGFGVGFRADFMPDFVPDFVTGYCKHTEDFIRENYCSGRFSRPTFFFSAP